MALPDGEKFLKIRSLILTELMNETNRHTDGQTPHDGIGRVCIASRGKNYPVLKFMLPAVAATTDVASSPVPKLGPRCQVG